MEPQHLAAELIAFARSDEQKWFPSLRRAIRDVDATIAATRIPHGNSIWAVVNHTSFWLELTRRRLLGEPSTLDEARESGWSLQATGDEASWQRSRDEVIRRAAELADVAAGLTDRDLAEEWAPGRAPKWQLLDGAVNHMSFHIGEILTIRAALGKPLDQMA